MKAILFDFDGVLTVDKYGSDSVLRYFDENTDVPFEVLKKEYYKINKGLLYGQYTHKDIWEEYCNRVGTYIDFQILIDSFINTPLDNGMLSIVKQLKEEYLVGMITDNKVDRIETILDYNGLNDLFDIVTVSAQCKCGKDERRIFDITIQALNVEAGECIFIDNSEKNLIVPNEMGMHTVLFDDEKRDLIGLKNELSKLLRY